MEFHVDGRGQTKRFVESLLPSMLEQLKLTTSKKFLHVMIDRDLEDLGTTVPLNGLDTYLVVIKSQKDKTLLGATLAHELTHVAQFAKGTLQLTPRGKLWKGKYYGRKVPYLDQPWEIQAFAKQEIVFRRAIEM
jgi:hypothetical protein